MVTVHHYKTSAVSQKWDDIFPQGSQSRRGDRGSGETRGRFLFQAFERIFPLGIISKITKGSTMNVRAKFKVESNEPVQGGEGKTVSLRPVVGGSPENDSFYKYTPGGHLVLSTINDEAAAALPVGQEVYLDITPIVAEAAAEESAADA
jgi:hypothetical protein